MTDWEIGNDLMHKIVDQLKEIAEECEKDRPRIANLCRAVALDFGPLVNRLMNDDGSEIGMCPTQDLDEHGNVSCYTYFDGTGNKVYNKFERKGI